jgi:hypothetical protein
MKNQTTTFWQLLLLAILVNVLAQAAHETGHLLVYQAYGRQPTWGFIGLVQRWGEAPLRPAEWTQTTGAEGETGWLRVSGLPEGKLEKLLAPAGGPLASLAFVLAGFWLMRPRHRPATREVGLMLALMMSFAITLYYLRSPLRSMGDEYDMAVQLGLPKAAVELFFAALFGVALALGLRTLAGWRERLTWLGAVFLGSVPTGLVLNWADGWIREGVNQGYPLTQPVFGYALPVLLVYLLAIGGIVWWKNKQSYLQERNSLTSAG